MADTFETYFRRYLIDPLVENGTNPPTGGTGGGGGGTPPIGQIIQGPPGPPGPQGPIGPAGPINTVENQGAVLITRATLNFTGAGVVTSDDSVNGRTNVTISGAASAGVTSFNTRTGAVVSAINDYSAAQVLNAVDSTQSYANPVWLTSLAWSKLTGTPTLVNSFNTRSGSVMPASGDYSASQVTNAVDSSGTYANPSWLTSLAWSKITGTPTLVNSFNTRTGAVVPASGDYTAAQVTNAVSTLGSYASPSWITSIAWSILTGVPTLTNTFNGRSGTVVPATGDYTAAQVTNAVDSTQTYNNPAWLNQLAWSKITGAPSISSYQTPWLSNINAAGYTLNNAIGINLNDTTNGGLSFAYQRNGLSRWALSQDNTTESGTATGSNFIIYRYNNSGVVLDQPFLITRATGNIGIGLPSPTTAASNQLHVATDTTRQLLLSGRTTLTNQMLLGFDASNNTGVVEVTSTGGARPLLFNPSGGNIGIGLVSPIALVEAYGAAGAPPTTGSTTTAIYRASTSGGGNGLEMGMYTASPYSAWIQCIDKNTRSATYPLALQPAGNNVGIGTNNPTHQLQLSTDDAAKLTTNTWTIASGAGVKQNVKDLKGGLEIIEKIRPVEAEYNGKANTPKGQRVVSVIAEEVRKVLPHTVSEDIEGTLGFNVHEVIFQLILAVQQLSAQVKKLEKN